MKISGMFNELNDIDKISVCLNMVQNKIDEAEVVITGENFIFCHEYMLKTKDGRIIMTGIPIQGKSHSIVKNKEMRERAMRCVNEIIELGGM